MLNMTVMKTVDILQVTLHAIYWCRYFVIYIYAFNIGWIRCKYVWLIWCTMMFFFFN